MNSYVAINRVFSAYPEDLGLDFSWDDIQERFLVLILGSGGIGKTTEFKYQVELLRKKGKRAFYLDIKTIKSLPLNTELEIENWLKEPDEGFFFLDSVDECKLISPLHFQESLKSICKLIQTKLEKTHIIISSRGANLVEEDIRLISNIHGLEKEERLCLETFTLKPLEITEAKKLIKSLTKGDLEEEIIKNIEHILPQNFPLTPLNIILLINVFSQYENFKDVKRLELYDSLVISCCQENDSLREHRLELKKFSEGIQKIAFSSIFSQVENFVLNDNVSIDGAKPYLNVSKILPQWSESEINEILKSKIFNFESPFFRFIHREITEFLAAKYIKEYDPLHQLSSTFYGYAFQEHYVTSDKKNILVWLGCLDIYYRTYLIKHHPEVFFSGGDFKELAFEEQCQVLTSLCSKISLTRGWSSYDYDYLSYMFNSSHAKHLHDLWESFSDENVKFLLALIIYRCSIVECYSLLRQELFKEQKHSYLNLLALRTYSQESISIKHKIWRKLIDLCLTKELFTELISQSTVDLDFCRLFYDSLHTLQTKYRRNEYQIQTICETFLDKLQTEEKEGLVILFIFGVQWLLGECKFVCVNSS